MIIVYRLVSKSEKMGYVGLTSSTPDNRFSSHCATAFSGSQSKIHDAIRRLGKDDFEIHVIAVCERKTTARKLESRFITQYNDYKSGYNMNKGGGGCMNHSTETRKRMSRTRLGHTTTAETRERISKSLKGSKHTEKSRENMRKSKLGKTLAAKKWNIRLPDGKTITVKNMAKFCREHGLHKSGMTQVCTGKYKQHKGYTCTKLSLDKL